MLILMPSVSCIYHPGSHPPRCPFSPPRCQHTPLFSPSLPQHLASCSRPAPHCTCLWHLLFLFSVSFYPDVKGIILSLSLSIWQPYSVTLPMSINPAENCVASFFFQLDWVSMTPRTNLFIPASVHTRMSFQPVVYRVGLPWTQAGAYLTE